MPLTTPSPGPTNRKLNFRNPQAEADRLGVALNDPDVVDVSPRGVPSEVTVALPSGWQLRVTVTRDAFPDGREFVRTGIVPDIEVGVRVDDVLAGRDAVLERARAYLTELARR